MNIITIFYQSELRTITGLDYTKTKVTPITNSFIVLRTVERTWYVSWGYFGKEVELSIGIYDGVGV